MKYLLALFAFYSVFLHGQTRENDPLPTISEKPISTWTKGITGWSKSLDGQWIYLKNTIPLRINSRTPGTKLKQERRIGEDNIEKLELYPVLYRTDTLVMLVKYSRNGSFDFENSRKSWQEWTTVNYFLFNRGELDEIIDAGSKGKTDLSIPLISFGRIERLRGDVIESISEKINLNLECNYSLKVKAARTNSSKDQSKDPEDLSLIRFQFYSYHDLVRSNEGIILESMENGKSLYHSGSVLDYLYYESDAGTWTEFFNFNPRNSKFMETK